jgi:hypothetical protein
LVPGFCGGKYGNTVVPAPSELEFMLYAKKCAKPAPSMSYMKRVYWVAASIVHATVGAALRKNGAASSQRIGHHAKKKKTIAPA